MFELHRIRTTFEAIYQLIVADRDAAREEVVTMRTALFPQLNRLQPKTEAKTKVNNGVSPTGNGFVHPKTLSRIPWRTQFTDLVRAHNTTQLGRDKMAAAIPEVK